MDDLIAPQLIKKGAEASIFLADWHERQVVLKKRLPKRYRHPDLDKQIRTYRTIHEPQLINEAKKAGVQTPTIFLVDVRNAIIVMQFIVGKQVKTILNEAAKTEREEVCVKIGKSIGRLHKHGVIHGDLTTSNMILTPKRKIFFVDFGLGEKNPELEAMGVDMHLMRRALQSTHFRFSEECFKAVFQGYSDEVGANVAKNVSEKMVEIRKRGRYVSERREEQ